MYRAIKLRYRPNGKIMLPIFSEKLKKTFCIISNFLDSIDFFDFFNLQKKSVPLLENRHLLYNARYKGIYTADETCCTLAEGHNILFTL